MIALLQRVSEATVLVKQVDVTREAGAIGAGLVVLVGVEKGDTAAQAERLLERLLAYRVFPDHAGKMNLNIEQVGGELMLVSQFTLAANTRSGNRPSFTSAADPETGRQLFDYLLALARSRLGTCATGEFGAHMMVRLVNDGPVTFRLRVPPEPTDN
ncbi:D-tyrosyl-tRNA(Tyr) deacylase [Marinihelvus fidelis]|uniref:D-aminoacyl-tRNA deacylase n=1 Tax=Marinihelvus fidelis TaxID=2613842 RepID=A0A5N0T984_9GAMM|nr:D-aminoacyl-tRNA deacylase [Marinihelvus fidelis]KAA9131331.1 D-tyrosyl-tRNA(Tyr) deacylase [Marinihelvus fidelis]